MAQVAREVTLQRRIDHYLDYLCDQWDGIPAVASEWQEWEDESRQTFLANWAVPRDRLHSLKQWAEQGLLSTAQRARYDVLLELVERQRPTLERLFGEPVRSE
ncbi:MAG TPA: hypothetical protein VII06_32850 [Chloroflexota bacterium]|jgi:hypothetical protein